MLLITFIILALSLTITMFALRQSMLGFPCGVFWFLAGAYSYSISSRSWSDPYYWLFFVFTLGMGLFTILAAFALRKSDIPDFAPGPPPDDTSEAMLGDVSADGEQGGAKRNVNSRRQSDLNKVFDTSSRSSQSAQAATERDTENRRVRIVHDRHHRGLRW